MINQIRHTYNQKNSYKNYINTQKLLRKDNLSRNYQTKADVFKRTKQTYHTTKAQEELQYLKNIGLRSGKNYKTRQNKFIALFTAGIMTLSIFANLFGIRNTQNDKTIENNNIKIEEYNESIPVEDNIDNSNDEQVTTDTLKNKDNISLSSPKEKIASINKEEIKEDIEEKPKLPEGIFRDKFKNTESLVVELCDKYNIKDYKFIAAIIGGESGWGGETSINNPMGYKGSGDLGITDDGYGIFSTPEEGLKTTIKNIADYTTRYNIKSIDIEHINEINEHYCDGSPQWLELIEDCYAYISKKEKLQSEDENAE